MIDVRFTYLTGLKRSIFRNARLRGSWDAGGRYTDRWTERPMQEIVAEDGCPAFTATVRLHEAGASAVFRWGVALDGPEGAGLWGIPTETPDPNAQRGHARKYAALEWRKEFFNDQNATYRKMYSGRRSIGTGQSGQGLPEGRGQTHGQLRLLLSRYFKVKVRDVGGTAIMLLQAPIIGILLGVVFVGQEKSIPAWCLGALQELSGKAQGPGTTSADVLKKMEVTTDHTAAAFFLVVAAIWFGTSNAAREIVSERAIYLRERMVNLGLLNYVLSKYLLLAFFCLIQCTVLLAIVFFMLGFHGGPTAFLQQLGALVATSLSAASWSTSSRSVFHVRTFTPTVRWRDSSVPVSASCTTPRGM